MFIRLTDKHKKVILWAMLIVIVPAFVLWGSSALRGDEENVIGQIEERPIKRDKFISFVELAQLYWMLNAEPDQPLEREDIYALAADFYLLLYQADKENIKVSDQEVVQYVQKMPFFITDGQFDSGKYQHFIEYVQRKMGRGFAARNFEEYVRNIIKREKLFNKHIDVTVTEEQVLEAYKIANQQAEISYLLIDYNSFNIDQNISRIQLENFYQENKDLFEVAPKIKVNYVSIDPNTEDSEAILTGLKANKDFSNLPKEEIKESDFFSKTEPIEGIGFVPEINKILFTLQSEDLSPAFRLKDKILIFKKIDETKGYTPPFSEIEAKVKEAYIKSQAKTEAEKIAAKIMKEIEATGNKNLKRYAQREEINFYQSEPFQYFNYIKGLGLSERISQLAFFELEEGQIHPEPISRKNGIYIVKLDRKTEIDQEKFRQEQEQYDQELKTRKILQERMEYLSNLQQRLNFRLNL